MAVHTVFSCVKEFWFCHLIKKAHHDLFMLLNKLIIYRNKIVICGSNIKHSRLPSKPNVFVTWLKSPLNNENKITCSGLRRVSLILLQCEESVSAKDAVTLLSLQAAALLYMWWTTGGKRKGKKKQDELHFTLKEIGSLFFICTDKPVEMWNIILPHNWRVISTLYAFASDASDKGYTIRMLSWGHTSQFAPVGTVAHTAASKSG